MCFVEDGDECVLLYMGFANKTSKERSENSCSALVENLIRFRIMNTIGELLECEVRLALNR